MEEEEEWEKEGHTSDCENGCELEQQQELSQVQVLNQRMMPLVQEQNQVQNQGLRCWRERASKRSHKWNLFAN